MSEIKNLFTKGWQNDSEPSLQPPNTVRDILNMRLISASNNTYSLENLKGTLLSFSLNPNYFPIGWTRFGNDIAILSTKDITGTDTNGEIGIATINPTTLIGTYTPLYNHQGLTFNSAHQIEAQSYIENNSIGRVYWTDEYNTFRALNLLNSTLTTYFTDALGINPVVVGVDYMVLTDSVTNGTSTYGPNEASGTVFTADGTEVYNGSPLVIEYIDVLLLDVVPARDQGFIQFVRYLGAGFLLSSQYQYCYQLYTSDGTETNFSYVSMPFLMANTATPAGSTLSYQAFYGGSVTDNSGKGQRIQIDNIDVNFDSIRVIAIQDISLIGANPPQIFFDGAITSATMTFDYLGNENLGTLSNADIEKVVLAIRRIGTLAILKKRMFIGDIEFSKFVRLDRTGLTAETIEYLITSDTSGRPDSSTDAGTAGLSGHGFASASGCTGIYTYQWYRVDGTGTITYNAVVYAVGDKFQGVSGVHTFAVTTGAPVVIAVLRIQKYTGQYRYIDILDDYVDNKGTAVASHIKSNRRGERKRYGLLLYDTFQNPMAVQWMMDKNFPTQYATTDPDTGNPLGYNPRLAEEIDDDYGAGLHGCYLRNLGVKFSGIDFQLMADYLGVPLSDLTKYIGGFSIVRAPEENTVYAQGVLQCTAIAGADTHPLSAPALANDKYGAANGRRGNSYTFFSPELQFLFDNQPSVIAGDSLRIEDYYKDAHQAAAGAGTLEANNYHYYEKLHAQQVAGAFPAKGSTNGIDLTKSFTVGVAETSHIIPPGPGAFQNNAITLAALFGGTERSCKGGISYFVTTTDDETGITYPTTGYVTNNDTKAIVSFIRANSNLYGGTGQSALAATQYIYCGHYQPMDAAFMTYLAGNAGVTDNIEVFGGDCYVSLYDMARMITDETVVDRCSFGFCFPVESAINISMRQGRHLFKDRTLDVASNPGINLNGIQFAPTQQLENFVYNNAYSYRESQFTYPALPINFVENDLFTRRVYVSPPKVDGEIVDNFRVYPINDYIDLEGQNGELINLRSKSGRLFYFQERAVGNLPVNQQTTIPNSLGQPISIGVGGVLELYNDAQNFYGNQHKFGLAEDENGFAWFDALRKVICSMSVDTATQNLSTSNGLRQFFEEVTGDILFNDNPVRNNGISAMYNAKFEEMLFSFRGTTAQTEDMQYAPVGFTVAFDNLDKQFTGKFSMLPGIMIEVNNSLFVAFTGAYPVIADATDYFVDDFVTEGTTNYVCILAYTSAGTAVQPSSDPTHWTKTTAINEVHIADIGARCKFFGHVDGNMVQPVLQLEDGSEDGVFDNVAMQSDQQFFDTAEYENSHEKTTEADIQNSDEYEFLNRSWFWSVPNDYFTGDRFRDHYMTLKLTKDNHVNGNPAVSKNEKVKIVSMRHTVRKSL